MKLIKKPLKSTTGAIISEGVENGISVWCNLGGIVRGTTEL